MYVDKSKTYIGIVEENKDPRKLGRCRVRVIDIFDDIPVEDIPWASPWKDLNGNQFNVPDVGKIVTVIFDSGNIYKPEYICSEHFNINLEQKLRSLSDEEYLSFKAIQFDHATQIYRTQNEGLKIDHEYTNINLDKNGNIGLNLRDNKSVIWLGSIDAQEDAVLGSTFITWFDAFIESLTTVPYFDSLGGPVVATTPFLTSLSNYKTLRNSQKILSNHVKIIKNQAVLPQTRDYVNQKGDNWSAFKIENNLTKVEPTKYTPSSEYFSTTEGKNLPYVASGANPGNPAKFLPSDQQAAVLFDVPTAALDKSKNQNGKLTDDVLQYSRWAFGEKTGKWTSSLIEGERNARLAKDAAIAFDALFDLYESDNFPGKAPLVISDGYRTFEQQKIIYDSLPGQAAQPGFSNHGWGLAMDILGIANPIARLRKNKIDRASVFKCPVYRWLFENGWKFGIYNPEVLRNGSSVDEWWHWEYHGFLGEPRVIYAPYDGVFTRQDYLTLRYNGVVDPSDAFFESYWEAYPDRNI